MAFLINENGERFAIPSGETVIGRGPYLRVKEKILSRSHALLSLKDGKLYIKPTHRHPTYFCLNNSSEYSPLERDDWKELKDNDWISLLPSSLKYRIEFGASLTSYLTQDQSKSHSEEEIDLRKNENDDVANEESPAIRVDTTLVQSLHECGEVNSSNVNLNAADEGLIEYTRDSPLGTNNYPSKKRKLPDWMIHNESSSSLKKKRTTKRSTKAAETNVASEETDSISFKDQVSLHPCIESTEIDESESLTSRVPVSVASNIAKQDISLNVSDGTENESSIHEEHMDLAAKSSIQNCEKDEYVSHAQLPSLQLIDSDAQSSFTHQNVGPQNTSIETSPEHNTCYEHSNQFSSKKKVSPLASNDISSHGEETSNEFASGNINSPDESLNNTYNDKNEISDNSAHHDYPDNCSKLEEDQSNNRSPSLHSSPYRHRSGNESPDNLNEPRKDSASNDDVETKESVSDSGDQKQYADQISTKYCPYGKGCYRKNPQHFQEYSHSSEGGEEGDGGNEGKVKPECPYGKMCYRQNNPNHTKELAHSTSGKQRRVRRSRRKAKKTKVKSVHDNASDNEGSRNDYDFNDSFIDDTDDSDGYSDDPDDSDYNPYGNSDDDEEDVDELLSEAKDYLRNKKL